MTENQKTLKSLRAGIKLSKYNPQLKETDEKQGTFAAILVGKQNANFRLDWTAPESETLSVIDGKYELYRPKLNQIYRGKTKEATKGQQDVSGILSLSRMSSEELRNKFDGKWQEPELIADGTISAYKLKLTPKTAASYDYAEIWVNDDGMPVQVKSYEKNKDTTTVLFYNVERNAKVSKDTLKIKNLPKDVKVVK